MSEFYSNKSRPDGLANECKHCAALRRADKITERSEYDADRYAANRDELRAYKRQYQKDNAYSVKVYWLRKNYNLSIEGYEEILRRQKYKCAVDGCGVTAFSETLSVDHDHVCCPEKGKSCGSCIRGLLCANCNRALGLLRDNNRIIIGLANYLEETK